MKELSIEEKAKRYDEAIKIAKEINNEQCAQPFNVMTRVFPELKESEDEKIRKEITTYLKSVIANKGYGDSIMESWIAWLEKQGEPKEINPSEFDSQLNRLLGQFKSLPKEELASSLSFYLNVVQNDGTYKEEKQGEHNPAEWEPQTGDTFRKKGTTSPTYHLCNKREDGITFGFVENREVGISGGEITIFALRNDYELVERPKSIEDVVEEELNKGLQTKFGQTWKEFEKVRMIIAYLEAYKSYQTPDGVDYINGCIDWLKSLRPRSQWKPSDEQMHYLSWIANVKLGNSVVEQEVSKHLNELLEDLKKLTE